MCKNWVSERAKRGTAACAAEHKGCVPRNRPHCIGVYLRLPDHAFCDLIYVRRKAKMEINSAILVIALGIAGYFVIATLRAIFWPSRVTPRGYVPRHVGDITLEELSKCGGEDPYRPLLVALRGRVFDVTEARGFYGPGGAYHVYAGREAARALGKMSLSPEDCTADLDDLSEKERATLAQWETKFEAKYKVVGQVRRKKEEFNLKNEANATSYRSFFLIFSFLHFL
jgi:membrane-associated progesterone receptor component